MKKVLLLLALGAFATGIAQENENKTEETTTVKTKVKTSSGEEVKTKKMTTTAKQKIAVAGDGTNQRAVKLPMDVETNADYFYDSKPIRFEEASVGYVVFEMNDGKKVNIGRIYPTKIEGTYKLKIGDTVSYGTFDADNAFQKSDANAIQQAKRKLKMEKEKQMMDDSNDDNK